MKRQPAMRKSVIAIAIIMSILLYFAGVLSGLYANKITEERTASSLSVLQRETEHDIASLKTGTEGQITNLHNYIGFLESNINTIQLQQDFLATLPREQACHLSTIPIGHMVEQLQYYRDKLPYRLEEYERENALTEEYLLLKEQYNALSIRTWIYARSQRLRCGTDVVDGLYFYSASCETCVRQGEELDTFTRTLEERQQGVLLFTVDANAKEPMVTFLKEYYNITSLPAVVVGDRVSQGRVFTADELLAEVR